jgi:hypothetical protein
VLTDTYVLILFRVFKCSYNYRHLEHDARDDNLVHSDVRNVNTQSPPEGGLASPDLPFSKPLLSRRLLSGPWSMDYGCLGAGSSPVASGLASLRSLVL